MFNKKSSETIRDTQVRTMDKEHPLPLTINGEVLYLPEGLSKLEQFACAALTGILANPGAQPYKRSVEDAFHVAAIMVEESENYKQ